MWCWLRKLGVYFYLTVFLIDAVVLFFCNGIALGLWMLSFGSLLTFCDGMYWPLVIDAYNESVWLAQIAARTAGVPMFDSVRRN
jgi:hypothetical protein